MMLPPSAGKVPYTCRVEIKSLKVEIESLKVEIESLKIPQPQPTRRTDMDIGTLAEQLHLWATQLTEGAVPLTSITAGLNAVADDLLLDALGAPVEDTYDEGDSEARIMAGMAHGNRGLADYDGLETDHPGGTGCYGCGGRGCESCDWGES
jgi:hypothetical protein